MKQIEIEYLKENGERGRVRIDTAKVYRISLMDENDAWNIKEKDGVDVVTRLIMALDMQFGVKNREGKYVREEEKKGFLKKILK